MVSTLGGGGPWGSIPLEPGSRQLFEGGRDVPVPAELEGTWGSSCHLTGGAA